MAKGLVLLCVLPLHEDSSYLKMCAFAKAAETVYKTVGWPGAMHLRQVICHGADSYDMHTVHASGMAWLPTMYMQHMAMELA